ncbi:hypothetical protein SAMN05421819_1894 [Bryocella elongata]|uniref:FecR family protein n=1 Tax=Bryocella elongata TaxID=863522 RepID=A0A1H5XP44_9BACT|nr:hypothetical protein [Bryocella elongata]SEG13140.1 hypothetical protein SAMN05421819_1894 [Bryocella elongata]
MSRLITTLAALATLSAGVAFSQDTTAPQDQNPAPIERSYAPAPQQMQAAPGDYAPSEGAPPPQRRMQYPRLNNASIAPGVWLRSTGATHSETLSATPDKVEIRIDHGVANLNVHHPDHRPQILVDLPGGQTAILKDGLYTFNADTNTVRTLKGEAEAYASASAKPVKVKEDHALTFGGEQRAMEFGPMDLRGDLLPGAAPANGEPAYGDGYGYYPGYAYGYPYGYGYGPYWGEPYWGGWGYPGFGVGIGFGYGGFYGGGFRGFRR